jgi:hypothetical protein
MADDEAQALLARLEQLMRELSRHSADTREEVLVASEQLFAEARKHHLAARDAYESGRLRRVEARAKRERRRKP